MHRCVFISSKGTESNADFIVWHCVSRLCWGNFAANWWSSLLSIKELAYATLVTKTLHYIDNKSELGSGVEITLGHNWIHKHGDLQPSKVDEDGLA